MANCQPTQSLAVVQQKVKLAHGPDKHFVQPEWNGPRPKGLVAPPCEHNMDNRRSACTSGKHTQAHSFNQNKKEMSLSRIILWWERRSLGRKAAGKRRKKEIK